MRLPDEQNVPGDELLRLARSSIEHGFGHDQPLPINFDELHEALVQPAATFTTLRLKEKLRGCCGALEAARPLAADVVRSAFQAAFRDSRFDPVRQAEMKKLTVEVSVLSALEEIRVSDEAELLHRLKPGSDGLVIVDRGRRATFLPKVWEQLPEPQRFLAQLKVKCGLPRDYWSERLAFLRYSTTTFAEPV